MINGDNFEPMRRLHYPSREHERDPAAIPATYRKRFPRRHRKRLRRAPVPMQLRRLLEVEEGSAGGGLR